MRADFYRHAGWVTSFTERYVLSTFYIVYSWAYWLALRDDWAWHQQWDGTGYASFAQHLTMLLLMFFEGVTLLLGRRATVTPGNLEEIAVPLAASFFYLVYGVIDWLPHWAQDSLLPAAWQTPLLTTGLGFDALGTVMATWGVLYLGRSFGIFVAVRKVVMRGPYRYVRHPIYCGYLCMFGGVALTYFCPAAFVFVAIHYVLFYYRARLEEKRLAAASPEYREYQQRTGMLLPKLP